METIRWIVISLLCALCAGCLRGAYAQAIPATQTAVPCAIGASPVKAANSCKAGQTYGVSLNGSSVEFLGQDTTRNVLGIQNTGANTACIEFQMDGTPATQATPQNCISIPTGQPMYFNNFNIGTTAGHGLVSAVSGISAGGTQITFFFMDQ